MNKGFTYTSFFLILVVVLLSIIPRLWKLDTSPPLIVDEWANIQDIDLIINEGFNITDFYWDFSKSRVVHILPYLLIKSGIEDKLMALRISSVILSILSLIPFFLIAKKLSNNLIAFSATLLFSFSYYFLQFSRVGWDENILNIFLGLSLFWIIIKIKESPKVNVPLIVLAGFVASFIFYSYRSGIILIAVSFILLSFKKSNFRKKRSVANHLSILGIFLITFLLFSFPWIIKITKNPEKYNLRLRVVSINSISLPNNSFENKSELLTYQIRKTADAWLFLNQASGGGNENPRYLPQGYPIVNLFVKIGFWIGFISGILAFPKTYPIYMVYFSGLLGQMITVDPPNGARGLIILPCIYLFFAFGLYKIYNLSGKSKISLGLIVVLSLIYAFSDFYFYKYWMDWIKV